MFTLPMGLLHIVAALDNPNNPTGPSSPHLNFSSPAPYIFSSVNGLLEQWSNTFFPNGHTIAACGIPAHTLLYHGRHDSELPPSPEWLSFDIEMAYGIMGSLPNSRMLSYRTTRAIKCLYFDGMSANLMSDGVESQMTFLYGDSDSIPSRPWPPRPGRPGKPPGDGPPRRGPPGKRPGNPEAQRDERPPFGRWNPLDDEYYRAAGLCNWIKEKGLGGKGWGFEGIVRMNAGFELIWCDFDSPSLRLVSNLNVSAPRIEMENRRQPRMRNKMIRSPPVGQVVLKDGKPVHQADSPEGPHGPGLTDPSEPFRGVANWMWFTAAARRYGFSGTSGTGTGRGEARVRVNTCGIFTFYDPDMEDQDAARVESERTSLNISADGWWDGPEEPSMRAAALEKLLRRRRPHRANHVSSDDGEYMRTAVENRMRAVLESERTSSNSSCSGVDWQLTMQEIVTFYSTNLRNLLHILEEQPAKTEKHWLTIHSWLESIRMLTHWFIMPFLEYPRGPYTNESLRVDLSMDSPVMQEALERCQFQYGTEGINQLVEGERLLSWAVDETLGGICQTIFEVGLGVEYRWLLHFNQDPERHKSSHFEENPLLLDGKRWKMAVEELMAWLGWAEQWTGCEGPCGSDVSLFFSSDRRRIRNDANVSL